MDNKRKHRRPLPDLRPKRAFRHRIRQNWDDPYPYLRPADRVSNLMDHRELMADYDALAAEHGKGPVDDQLDYFYFFLGHSWRLLDEPEFEDASVEIDGYDFLLDEAMHLMVQLVEQDESLLDPEGGYAAPYSHILEHAMRRYVTPELRRDLSSRAERLARRREGSGIGTMADHLLIALEDEGIPAGIIGLFQRLFSNAILDGLRHHDEQVHHQWEERDRSLDRWMDEIAAGDFDHPAERAVEALVAAGTRALPHLVNLVYDEDRTYGDFSVWTALGALARIPSQRSLSVLVGVLLDDDDLVAIEIPGLLAQMPDLACPYVDYALTVPGGPDEWTTVLAHEVLVEAKCPRAFEHLVEGLSYQGESPDEAEAVQVGASFGLLEIGDRRAIPVLHSWLQNPEANGLARYELLREITRSPHDYPWAKEIAGDLTLDTLP